MKKYKFKVRDLDCANCAREIEEHLNKDVHLKEVSCNFTKLTLSLETDLEENVKNYVQKKAKEAEPEVKILELGEESNHKKTIYLKIARLAIGILLAILSLLIKKENISLVLMIVSYCVLLINCFINAIKLLIKKHTINENLLITISCIGAFLLGEIQEGLMVVILYEIGKLLETFAVNNSRKSIAELMDIKPEYANLKTEEGEKRVNPSEVLIGNCIIIKKGEKIPLDGIIVKGETILDTKALTGESKLREVRTNDEVLSGSINEGNLIEIEVTKDYENSTVSKLLDLVENASERKAKGENFVARAAKIYTPIVLLLAIISFLIMNFCISSLSTNESIYRALSFLVVSCPCAIAISVPLSYFTGIGACSKRGILIKGSDYLDNIRLITKIIFDKTGTITTGEASDCKLTILNKNYKEKEIIDYYVKGESLSNHPIAKSIIHYYGKKGVIKDIKDFKEITGKGIEYTLSKKKIKIGNYAFVGVKEKDSCIYLKIDKEIVAKIELMDSIKKEAPSTIKELKRLGIKTIMFTGDEEHIARNVATEIGIDEVKYELLPEDKYNLLKEEIIHNQNGKTAFIGDGINDAPSIRLADIGISMGNVGSSSAIKASDVVIAEDELSKLIDAIKISKFTNKIIKQDLIFSLGTKVLVLLLCALGITGMMAAVFADTGVTLLAILNTTRILKYKR